MTECVSFILPLIQSKKETSKVPRKMGLYWDCDPQMKENNKKQPFHSELRAAREPACGAGCLDGLGVIVPPVGVAPVQGARALPRATLLPRAAPG